MPSSNPYLNRYDQFARFGSPSTRITTRKEKKKEKKRQRRIRQQISLSEPTPDWNVIYGTFRLGGVFSYIDTGNGRLSKAKLTTGVNNHSLSWTAVADGSEGNDITVTITSTGTNPSIIVSVVGTAITVQVKSTSGTPQSTAQEVITAVSAHGPASALVDVKKAGKKANGTVQPSATKNLTGGGGVWLHTVHTLCCHEIESLEAVYLDDQLVEFGATPDPRWAIGRFDNKVFSTYNQGTDDQEVLWDLHFQAPDKWTDDHRQRGCAHVYLICEYDKNIFPNGLPDFAFLVKGRLVYDPRDGTQTQGDPTTWKWSENAALCIADYLTNTKFGLSIPYSQLNQANLIEAADICDELVTTIAGTEKRYTINGTFDTSQTPREILEDMAQAIAGSIVYSSGEWFIFPGKYRAPTITLTDANARGEIIVRTRNSRRQQYNEVKGTFLDAANKWEERDFPTIKNSTYLTKDGGIKNALDLDFAFVTSAATCQRIAKIELEKSRQGISVTFPCDISGIRLRPEDTVQLTISKFGWTNKVFTVTDVTLEIVGDDNGRVIETVLELEETVSGVYDWNSGEETTVDLAPNTNLQSPWDVSPPTNLVLSSGTNELYRRLDGTIATRLKVEWTAPSDVFVTEGGHYEIEYKKTSDSIWQTVSSVNGQQTFVWILDVHDGNSYDVRVRARNGLGAFSSYLTGSHTVVGKSAPPSDVTGFSVGASDLGLRFSWLKIADLDVKLYEIREGTTWDSAALVGRTSASDGETSFLFQSGTTGARTFLIKAQDTTGNYSTSAASAVITVIGPSAVQNLRVDAITRTVIIDWTDPTGTTFSVNKYRVYKGPIFSSAVLIGTVFGTFHTYVEDTGGPLTFHVVPIDAFGNEGAVASASVTVTVPDDFFIQSDVDLMTFFLGNYENCVGFATGEPTDRFFLPVEVGDPVSSLPLPFPLRFSETWDDWLTDNGWNTLQDAIDAGHETWLSPGNTDPGYIEFYADYGAVFSSSYIKFSWLQTMLTSGSITLTPKISTSPDGSAWTDYDGVSEVFASNFRYVKYRLSWTASSANVLGYIESFRAQLSLQRDEENQTITANAGDVGGTPLTFVKDFLDVEDIQLTPKSTDPAIVVHDFVDVASPTGFNVFVFDEDGTRITREVRARIRGAVSPG